MKKLSFICMILTSLLFYSCKESNSDYIEQVYTDARLTSAARTCLTTAKDTALQHLCVPDGFNASTTYRFQFPNDALFRSITDTLTAHNQQHLLDTITNQLNRTCEQIGNAVSSSCKSAIAALSIPDPASLIYSTRHDALTNYFRTQCDLSLLATITTLVAAQMQTIGAAATWNTIQTTYYQSGAGFIQYNLTETVAQNMLTAIFAEMAKEETLIRTDDSHATASNLNIF